MLVTPYLASSSRITSIFEAGQLSASINSAIRFSVSIADVPPVVRRDDEAFVAGRQVTVCYSSMLRCDKSWGASSAAKRSAGSGRL